MTDDNTHVFERADESSETDDDETMYAQGRLPGRTYVSRSFPLKRTNSTDDGNPARFIYKVFDPSEETEVEVDGEEWVVSETPAGRYQVKLLVARESGNVKELWVQRVPAPGSGGQVANRFNLKQPEAGRLIELLRNLGAVPIEGDTGVRVDDQLLADIFANPDSVAAMYTADRDRFRELIASDSSARDVIALAGRRTAVERFRRLIEDDDYFDSAVREIGSGSAERVWQKLFEDHPWMLGATLASQVLTGWDSTKLEQAVTGPAISGVGKRSDALLRTTGRIRSMVFAEIKTHRTNLLLDEYRSGCWAPSKELSGGVAQVQGTVHRAVTAIGERIASQAIDGGEIPGDFTYLIRPRSILIIGRLSELTGVDGGDHVDKIRSFELFRRQLIEPEIVTFDELLARSEWVVEAAADERARAGDL